MFELERTLDEQLREFRGSKPTLIFPEADDPRILEAASHLIAFAKVVLARSRDEVERDLDTQNVTLKVSRKRFLGAVRCRSPRDEPELTREFAEELVRHSAGRSWEVDAEEARRLVEDPVYFSILAVRLGCADAVLGGVAHASRDFFRPCLRLLDRQGTVYEMALFALPDSHAQGIFQQNLVMFSDVALNPEPSSERLADIAVGACTTMRQLVPPSVLPQVNGAILSYSTRGSGTGASVERIRGAELLIAEKITRLRERDPLYESVNIASELQISCAISPEAAFSKLGEAAIDNPAVGHSNVLIAPSLDTGNLLYHIYNTRYPEAKVVLVIGGMRNQALDFSRGSVARDVVLGAKALILRLYRSGRFVHTRRDHFYPRHKILTLFPRTSSTELALWAGRDLVGRERFSHPEEVLSRRVIDQLEPRLAVVRGFLEQHGVRPGDLEVVVGRGGLVLPVRSGIYRVDDAMVAHLSEARSGENVSNLGAIMAREIAGEEVENVFIIDPPVVDELDETARITGLAESEQEAAWHALAQKSVARLFAMQRGEEYEDLRLIVAYLGTGISIGAHVHGRCVKVRNALFDGPMSPVRSGSLPGLDLIELCFTGMTKRQVVEKISRYGGLRSYLGTADLREVERSIEEEGSLRARLVFDALVQQIAAEIASLAPTFRGEQVDRVLLTGEMVRSARLVRELRTCLASLGLEIAVYPGNREIEGMRDGALSVLYGQEEPQEYRPLRSRL